MSAGSVTDTSTRGGAVGRLPALAAALTALQALLLGAQVVLDQKTPNAATLGSDIFGALTVLMFAVVGLVVIRRYPAHRVGWLFVLTNLPWAVNSAAGAWVRFALGTSLPGVPFAVWLYPWQGSLGFGMTIAILYVFPSGTLPSISWRLAVLFLAVVTILGAAVTAFAPGHLDPTVGADVSNPYPAPGALGAGLAAVAPLQFAGFTIALVLGVAALALRFVRSRGLERQQLKWFAWAASVFGLLLVAGVLTSPLGDTTNFFWTVALVLLPLIPIAAGFAILRYRLYDVDLVINRTIVYASLTALLGAVYAASVLSLQALLRPLTGSSSLAVAISTLLVAALFSPARRRVQALVDQRFYRQRYDATREIAGFGARLREEVEPQRLAETIASTLDRTVQPVFASIWLREGGR